MYPTPSRPHYIATSLPYRQVGLRSRSGWVSLHPLTKAETGEAWGHGGARGFVESSAYLGSSIQQANNLAGLPLRPRQLHTHYLSYSNTPINQHLRLPAALPMMPRSWDTLKLH